MNLSASPALKQVESRLGISSGSFAGKHYHSVFDIIRQSRKQFITTNISWLGSRSGTAWDLAMGQAQYIRRLFRESRLTQQIREALPGTLSGHPARGVTSQTSTQGLVQNGPDWQNQFGSDWEAYCQSGSPEAFDSPVSYLTWLYNQAMEFEQEMESAGGEIISLSERRPDLATMMVDNDAVNQEIPALQLVNEILENNISLTLGEGETVDKTLASTRYPTLLPYHFPHDQTELALLNSGVMLEDIISQTSTDWPWFLNGSLTGTYSNNATELASRLAPEQQTIVTEAAPTTTELTTFYKTNLGLETADYTPFENLDTFTHQLDITAPQMEQLIAGNAGGTSVTLSPNISDTTTNPGVLTSADAQLLASSTTPLPQVTGLSLGNESYYSLDAVDYAPASENYGASFINTAAGPAIKLNVVSDAELFFSKATYADGKYQKGLQISTAADSYLYLKPDGIAAQAMKGDKSFTLGFWLYTINYSSERMPIFSNAGETDSPAYSPGFSLTAYDNGTTVGFTLSDQQGKSVANSWAKHIYAGTWYYVALAWHADTKKADWYAIPDGTTGISAPTVTLDGSTLGDICTAPGFTWVFGALGDFTVKTPRSENIPHLIYDDIAVFNGALSFSDINTLVSAQKPVAEMDLSSLSAGCLWSLSLDAPTLQNLSDPRMDRINRMVRLQRWLGLTYEETDLLLSACIAAQGTNNTDYSLNAHTLRALGVFRHWQQKYGVTAFQFAAVLHQITPYAISPAIPFLDQVFNAPSLFEDPFAITGETINYTDVDDSSSSRVVKQLCAGLGLTQAQFRVLADKVGDSSAHTFPLTLDSVSALYRLAMIPRWLGLSFAEGAALFSLVGQNNDTTWATLAKVPQLAALSGTPLQPTDGDILDTLMALDAAADWAKEHGLSWVKNYLALQPAPETLTATAATVNFVNSIKQQLPATLLSDQNFAGVPMPIASPPPASVVFSCPKGSGRAPGIINQTALLLDSTQGGFGQSTDNASKMMTCSSDFTLGFWVYIPTSSTTTGSPVVANAKWGGQGINIALNPTMLNIALHDSTGAPLNSPQVAYKPNTWVYLSVVLDTKNKTVTLYVVDDKGTCQPSPVDYTSFTGVITTPAGNHWCLNEDGTATYFDSHASTVRLLTFDDVTLWDLALTQEQVTTIATSGQPANESVPDAMSGIAFTFIDWMTTLGDLVSNTGLVRATATDYDTINALVQSDIAGLDFDDQVNVSQLTDTLTGIIYQAMLAQNGIADSALAQMFNTQQALSSFLFRWATDSEYRLLSDTLDLNGGEAVTDPAVITADTTYLTLLYALEQRAEIAGQFSLTPAALSTFLAHPGWLDAKFTALTPSLALLHRFSRYSDWLKLAIKEDAVLAYLVWGNGSTPPDAASAAKALAALLSWEASEVEQAAAGLPDNVLIAKTVADVDYVMRLQRLSAKTGLSVTPLQATGQLAPGNVTDTWDKWQSAGESLVAAQTENK